MKFIKKIKLYFVTKNKLKKYKITKPYYFYCEKGIFRLNIINFVFKNTIKMDNKKV